MENNLVSLQGGSYTALIDLNHGANCISLRHCSGAVLLREPQDPEHLDNPYLYGMPILFPVNRIEGGVFYFEGRKYEFPINEPATNCALHGVLHNTAFTAIARTGSAVKCRYAATKDAPYLQFPHNFEILIEYALREDGFHHTVTITNLSQQNMPVFLGFHTTFNTLFTPTGRPENIRVFADITEEYRRNMAVNYLPTGEKPPFDATSLAISRGTYRPFAEKASRHYRGCGNMSITDLGNRLRMMYENDEKYPFRLIYNGGEEGYICLEPQTCLANCPNAPFPRDEAGFDFLKANEKKTYHARIYLEEF